MQLIKNETWTIQILTRWLDRGGPSSTLPGHYDIDDNNDFYDNKDNFDGDNDNFDDCNHAFDPDNNDYDEDDVDDTTEGHVRPLR